MKPEAGWRLTWDRRGAAGDPERDTIQWASGPRPAGKAIDVECAMANPPERIALKWGDWLPHAVTLHVTLMAGDQVAYGAENEIVLQMVDAAGPVVQQDRRKASRGRVEFPGLQHHSASGDHVFRLSSPGLPPAEVRVRPAPAVPGKMK